MSNKLTFKDVPLGDGQQPTRQDVDQQFSKLAEVIKALPTKGDVDYTPALVDELNTRLEQLRERYEEAMLLNDQILAQKRPRLPWFDPKREAFVHEVDGEIVELLKLNRKDPNTPVSVSKVFEGGAFVPGSSAPAEFTIGPDNELQKKLGARVEDFYYAASKLWDLVEKDYLGKSKSKFIGVKMVRNRLLEHAEKGAANSFGVTSHHGPIVKPMRSSDAREEPFDGGLILNASELLDKSSERLSG